MSALEEVKYTISIQQSLRYFSSGTSNQLTDITIPIATPLACLNMIPNNKHILGKKQDKFIVILYWALEILRCLFFSKCPCVHTLISTWYTMYWLHLALSSSMWPFSCGSTDDQHYQCAIQASSGCIQCQSHISTEFPEWGTAGRC